MNRKFIFSLIGVVVIMLLSVVVVAPYFIGKAAEKRIFEYAEMYSDPDVLNVVVEDYQRGWFSSKLAVSVSLASSYERSISGSTRSLKNLQIKHGPILWEAKMPQLGVASAHIDEDPRYFAASIWPHLMRYSGYWSEGEILSEDPVTASFTLKFNHQLMTEIVVPAIEYQDDNDVFSLDGLTLVLNAFLMDERFSIEGVVNGVRLVDKTRPSFGISLSGMEFELNLLKDVESNQNLLFQIIMGDLEISTEKGELVWEGGKLTTELLVDLGEPRSLFSNDASSVLSIDGCDYARDFFGKYEFTLPTFYSESQEEGEQLILSYQDVAVSGEIDVIDNSGVAQTEFSLGKVVVNDQVFGPFTLSSRFENFNAYEWCVFQHSMIEFLQQKQLAFMPVVMMLLDNEDFINDAILFIFGNNGLVTKTLYAQTPYGEVNLQLDMQLHNGIEVTDWLSALFLSVDFTAAAELLEKWVMFADGELFDLEEAIEVGLLIEQDQQYQLSLAIANNTAIFNHDESSAVLLQ